MITDFVWTESIISSPHFTFRRGITAHSNGIGGCHNIYSFLGVSPRSAYDRGPCVRVVSAYDRGPCEWWVQVVASAHVHSCISSFLPSTSTTHCPCNTERKEAKETVKSCMIEQLAKDRRHEAAHRGGKNKLLLRPSSQNGLRRDGPPWSLNFVCPIRITKYLLLSQS